MEPAEDAGLGQHQLEFPLQLQHSWANSTQSIVDQLYPGGRLVPRVSGELAGPELLAIGRSVLSLAALVMILKWCEPKDFIFCVSGPSLRLSLALCLTTRTHYSLYRLVKAGLMCLGALGRVLRLAARDTPCGSPWHCAWPPGLKKTHPQPPSVLACKRFLCQFSRKELMWQLKKWFKETLQFSWIVQVSENSENL